MIGFVATAYTTGFWLIGLGLFGEKFYFPANLSSRPLFYIAPAVLFLILHTQLWYISEVTNRSIPVHAGHRKKDCQHTAPASTEDSEI
jgi:hypothetical protein